MPPATFQIECRWCGHMIGLRHRDNHGRVAPFCVGIRSHQWMIDNDYSWPGRDRALLATAGLLRRLPTWDRIHSITLGADGTPNHFWEDVCKLSPVAPKWSIRMARRLMEDQAMLRRLKLGKQQDRVGIAGKRRRQREGLPVGRILVVPIELRAKIIRHAAGSVMARTMFEDEGLETAIVLIRDLM